MTPGYLDQWNRIENPSQTHAHVETWYKQIALQTSGERMASAINGNETTGVPIIYQLSTYVC